MTPQTHENPIIDRYVVWLEGLGIAGVHRIAQFTARDVRHRTPETEGAGPQAVAAIFAGIFEGQAVVKTKVIDRASGNDGHTVYLRWDRLVTRGIQKFAYSGVSEIMLGMDGKIASIVDHWDSVPPKAPKGMLARLLKR